MILMTVQIAKFLLLFAIMLCCISLFHKKLSLWKLLYFEVLIIIFAILANTITEYLPSLTDQVTLTALGESREEAQDEEIFLAGYTIDGEQFLSGKSLKIEEGHWFWSSEDYCWRSETDTRQPEGVTRTVVLRIPVGWYRTLNFRGDVFRGMVQVSAGEETWIVDTYAEKACMISKPIGKSDSFVLIFNQVRYLFAYSFILILLSTITMFVLKAILQNPTTAKNWLSRNWDKCMYGGIALVISLLMFHFADIHSFWLDELHYIGVTKGSLKEALYYCMNSIESSPPLASLISTIWYRIAPYGEKWLLLVSIVLSALSIYCIGLIGKELIGKWYGCLASIIMACSTCMWIHVAYDYRAYAYFVFFSTFTIYSFVIKNRNVSPKKWKMIFSISLVCMAMSHYFGMLACAGYFCADLWLFLKRRQSSTCFLSYILPGIISGFWMILIFTANAFAPWKALPFDWQPIPDLRDVDSLLRFLTGSHDILYLIFILGIAISFGSLIFYNFFKNENKDYFYWIFFAEMIVGTIVLLTFYGNYISPHFTLWVNKYFLSLFPHVCLICAWTVYKINIYVFPTAEREPMIKVSICIFFAIFLSLNVSESILNPKAVPPYETFKNDADWIYTQSDDIYNNDTVILYTHNLTTAMDGWSEYYIERQGRRDPLNVVSYYDIVQDELLEYKYVYLQYRNSYPSQLKDFLNENFQLEKTGGSSTHVEVYKRI